MGVDLKMTVVWGLSKMVWTPASDAELENTRSIACSGRIDQPGKGIFVKCLSGHDRM